MKITRSQATRQREIAYNYNYGFNYRQLQYDQPMRTITYYDSNNYAFYSNPRDISDSFYPISASLCRECDALKYCQYARNLSHNHDAHFTSHKVINGDLSDQSYLQPSPPATTSSTKLPEQHILAEKLKLRYKTCPFHRELSLGLERSSISCINLFLTV